MKGYLKRVLAGIGVVAVAAGVAPILTASPAFALGTLQGAATINNPGGSGLMQSGNGDTGFTLRLPSGAACGGDSTNDGYRWHGYMVSGAINPDSLTFGSTGPSGGSTGTYATFKQPLYTIAGSPVVNQNTADKTPPGTTGPILGIPDMNFAVFTPGDIPAGVYNLGIACTLGPASATQMKEFWNVQMTVTQDAATGGAAQIHWENGTTPGAPVISTVTAATTNATSGQASVAFTNPAANPALTNCSIVVGTTAGGSQFGTFAGACTSPRVVTGLAYGQQYFFRMTSTNAVGTSPVSNEVNATSVRPAVANLSALPSPNAIALDWDDATLLGTDTYNVARCTLPATSPCTSAAAGYVATTNPTASNATFGSLVAGQVYAFTVTYGAAGTSLASSVQGTPLSNSILLQDVTVGRPNGALVLTQVCGKFDAMAAESAQLGFPAGLPASTASATGTAPTIGGVADDEFNEYPYPENPQGPGTGGNGTSTADYPSLCGIDLGTAKFVKSGQGAGQFFAASGRLSQVTIVDTRDTDPGWTVNFTMGDFSAGPGKSFSGNQLGYTVQMTDNPGFTDGSGFTYDQTATLGSNVAPNQQGAAGAGAAHAVLSVPDTAHGLGIATLDARLKVLIPVHEQNGTYVGTLTINAV